MIIRLVVTKFELQVATQQVSFEEVIQSREIRLTVMTPSAQHNVNLKNVIAAWVWAVFNKFRSSHRWDELLEIKFDKCDDSIVLR